MTIRFRAYDSKIERFVLNVDPKPAEPFNKASTIGAAELNIRGKAPTDRLQLQLIEGKTIRIGRAPHDSGAVIPWDPAISREHAIMCWENGRLRVTCLAKARNPIVFRKETMREALVSSGESFSIGTTSFAVISRQQTSTPFPDLDESTLARQFPEPREFRAYLPGELQRIAFRNAEQQMEFLSQLPAMISESHSDTELGHTVCGLLMDAIPHAEAVAVAQYDMINTPEQQDLQALLPSPVMMRVQTRKDFLATFRPSRSIITRTLQEQKTVLHIWDTDAPAPKYTISDGLEWAVCAPIRGESCEGWCMYVSGKGSAEGGLFVSENELLADVRFIELVGQFIGSVRHLRLLNEQRNKLNVFFSPKVIDSLMTRAGEDALAPAERNITVLFCDVRGFSSKAEKLKDNLISLLESVRAALGVMVDGILDRDGAIADFQGDAALGFWGWPVALEYGPIPACRAAIAIHNEFRKQAAKPGSLLEGFTVGIGIAHGRAIAGQIGTRKQSKIGVFGPVVNQCARLESMTKQFGVSICIDAATAEFVDRYFSPSDGRLRRLATVRPHGMQAPMEVFNLLPPESEFPEVLTSMITLHEIACKNIANGRWSEAIAVLDGVPQEDGPKQFLIRHLAGYNNTPPENWDGTFALDGK